jgi:hypothetical protein
MNNVTHSSKVKERFTAQFQTQYVAAAFHLLEALQWSSYFPGLDAWHNTRLTHHSPYFMIQVSSLLTDYSLWFINCLWNEACKLRNSGYGSGVTKDWGLVGCNALSTGERKGSGPTVTCDADGGSRYTATSGTFDFEPQCPLQGWGCRLISNYHFMTETQKELTRVYSPDDMQPEELMEPKLRCHPYALIFPSRPMRPRPNVPWLLGGSGHIGSLHRLWIRTFNIVTERKARNKIKEKLRYVLTRK